jgi:hypothetical protein
MIKMIERVFEFFRLWGSYYYEDRIDAKFAWELAGIFTDHPIPWDGMIIIKKDGE